MTIRVFLCTALLLSLAGCKPPATDDYVERVNLVESRGGPSEPQPSPDATGALWTVTAVPTRILYGISGEAPLMALTCEVADAGGPGIRITRYAPADPKAKALFALVGNGHIARLPVDAVWNGRAWLWEGKIHADDPRLDVLTGTRAVAATLPGAGKLELNPSAVPGQLIDACRLPREPAQATEPPA